MSAITDFIARQVWDSRGRPTIEVEITLSNGTHGRAIAPSGASTGTREALDRRDGGTRLGGYGVEGPLADLNTLIGPLLAGRDATDQAGIDSVLIDADGTPQKSRLGGNALVATSCAVAWAASADAGQPLWAHLQGLSGATPTIPLPMIQIFGGGRHAAQRVDVQDYLVLCIGASSFAEAMEWTAEIYMAAAARMRSRKGGSGVADEGGIWPEFRRNEDGFELIVEAIVDAGLRPGRDVGIAVDVAASSFAVAGGYRLGLEARTLETGALIERIVEWVRDYPIVSLEDPLGENDRSGFVEITRRLGDRVQIVGDDYLVTNAATIERAGTDGAANAALLKVNQCGTLTELIAAVGAANALGWNTVQSGRSGESEDVTLSHLAVGLGSHQIKVGSMTRSERTAKWNEVLRIAEQLPDTRLWRFPVKG